MSAEPRRPDLEFRRGKNLTVPGDPLTPWCPGFGDDDGDDDDDDERRRRLDEEDGAEQVCERRRRLDDADDDDDLDDDDREVCPNPTCPDGSAATCCDVDGDCDDGDDDWCCGTDFLCTNDSPDWAAHQGGVLCCSLGHAPTTPKTWPGTTGWCRSELDFEIGNYNGTECWAACEAMFGAELVAVDWDATDCYCQDACACMDDHLDPGVGLATRASARDAPGPVRLRLLQGRGPERVPALLRRYGHRPGPAAARRVDRRHLRHAPPRRRAVRPGGVVPLPGLLGRGRVEEVVLPVPALDLRLRARGGAGRGRERRGREPDARRGGGRGRRRRRGQVRPAAAGLPGEHRRAAPLEDLRDAPGRGRRLAPARRLRDFLFVGPQRRGQDDDDRGPHGPARPGLQHAGHRRVRARRPGGGRHGLPAGHAGRARSTTSSSRG